jgi:hypothetical protein
MLVKKQRRIKPRGWSAYVIGDAYVPGVGFGLGEIPGNEME